MPSRANVDEAVLLPELQIPDELGELERTLRIDKHNLDEDMTRHAELFHRVSREFTMAVSRRDQLKLRKAEKEAELDRQVRMNWDVETHGKDTEGAIKARILLMPAMRKLNQEYLNASTIADLWEALKDGYNQRSYMLKEMVASYISGYWQIEGRLRLEGAARDYRGQQGKHDAGQRRREDPAYEQVRGREKT